ncbi:3-hydroxyacyl-CoA dehydrogenase NAD-binding domain-containing protein [Pseudomonas sp. 21LCFQ010]|uniref:3-hydroxyacyl-CoA dehydrogenase NAD-binding domain-containing protein n=1 Tax=Pseudomonas sp. 21LCFQ010 TaxID=2957506 RepID=UPI002096D419|nr:3-hydroxyacyl-CoA dehydrogenase NAD-binding domain-containing protein [Pseudomonas sp. 21LCFQ010]MCO8164889.1 3-hydroxyacyl-CoA dehydrogenase NAD-binding domain-containing protein [Pseudomonas sp. 21LCFQ010]
MNSTVVLQRDGEIALLLIDNPPVNALSRQVREQLLECLHQALGDKTVTALVIASEGNTFVAGADIKEFDLPLQAPHLPDLLAMIENATKPVIAALHGSVFGGGLELALACHYRLAEGNARFALPEVSLGLIPGAGGTQRLPRLCGALAALEMVVGGERIDTARALQIGLIDKVVATELRSSAISWAYEVAQRPPRRVREQPIPAYDAAVFNERAAQLLSKLSGQEAPPLALEALQQASRLPFEAGMAHEREIFIARRQSPQAHALRHVFFAERELAARVRAHARSAPTRSIETVAVIGAGLMGSGIALCLANTGIPTLLVDTQEQALERGRLVVERYYQGSLEKGKLNADEASRRTSLIRYATTLSSVADADLIIEAVFEDLAIKQEVFRQLDQFAKPGAILATNTSYLDVTAIASATSRPGDVIGMHFFSPAQVMRLLEVVRTPQVLPEVLASVLQLGARLGKTAIAVGNCYGFAGNRLLAVREREAGFLLEEGASPQDVDRVIRGFGFPMGPFELRDLSGVDIAWRNRQGRAGHLSEAERRCDLIEQLHAAGRLGQKSGAGYYRYEQGQRRGVADEFVSQMLVEHRRRRGITPRPIGDDEILARCLFVMINEAAHLLEQGIVDSVNDIDLVWLHGYGFPRYKGGLLYYADQVGLATVATALSNWARAFAERGIEVSGMLQRMAEEGRSFTHG